LQTRGRQARLDSLSRVDIGMDRWYNSRAGSERKLGFDVVWGRERDRRRIRQDRFPFLGNPYIRLLCSHHVARRDNWSLVCKILEILATILCKEEGTQPRAVSRHSRCSYQ